MTQQAAAVGDDPREETSPPRPHTALLVDDDLLFRESLALLVRREGFQVTEASTVAEARARLADGPTDVAFVDLALPDGHGLELLDPDREPVGETDVVVITGNATVDAAVSALRQGVLDFLTKPVDQNRLRAILANVVRTRALRRERDELRDELRDLGHFGGMVGRSAPMRQVYDMIARVAPTRATVLLLGESGTGKELAAETLHRMSPRADRRFLAINCGAMAPNLIESELFGHEKGSFTGAERSRRGYFEEASGGTLFLDEITEMPAEAQVKLLRVLETGELLRVGASEHVGVDVRVIAASNRDAEGAVREGKLREDLYYRLNVFPIRIPPLRERGDDIELLAAHFLEEFNQRESTSRRWSHAALRRLRAYPWPGNVRELRNVVERAAIMAEDLITDPGLPQSPGAPAPGPESSAPVLTVPVGQPVAEVERRLILATLRLVDGDKREAARRLGISLKTLYNRLNVYEAAGQLESRPPSRGGNGATPP